jgi:hypothetical protein
MDLTSHQFTMHVTFFSGSSPLQKDIPPPEQGGRLSQYGVFRNEGHIWHGTAVLNLDTAVIVSGALTASQIGPRTFKVSRAPG